MFLEAIPVYRFAFNSKVTKTNDHKRKHDHVKGPPPPFLPFLDLEDGKADRAEIFTTDRAHQITRHVSEEKSFTEGLCTVFLRVLPCHCTTP
jgi:hypothetical protein